MFTGLIERTGVIADVQRRGNGSRLKIAASGWTDPLVKGESIAVSGACLTVSQIEGDSFFADVLKETLELTSLNRKGKGALVNIERALKAGDRMGGHLVTGHVDAVAKLSVFRKVGEDHVVRAVCGSNLMREIVVKGSVALDGISLTVTAAGDDWFEVHIIPTTWRETSLGESRMGDIANIETDVIAKYVRKYVGGDVLEGSILERMKRAGFA